MKKISIIVLCFFIFLQTKAQDEPEQKLFKKENFFTGGTLNLAFGSQVTNLTAPLDLIKFSKELPKCERALLKALVLKHAPVFSHRRRTGMRFYLSVIK